MWLNKNPYKYLLKRPILVNRNVIHFSFPVEWSMDCTKHLVSMISVCYSRWYLFYVNISILKTNIACWLARQSNCHTDKMNFYCFWSWLRNNHIFMAAMISAVHNNKFVFDYYYILNETLAQKFRTDSILQTGGFLGTRNMKRSLFQISNFIFKI